MGESAFAMLLNWLFDNILIVVGAVVLVFFAYQYLKVSKKAKWKVIDRRKIELANFVDSMKYNFTDAYVWLYKGKKRIGRIINYAEFSCPKNIVIFDPKAKGKAKFIKPQNPRKLKRGEMMDIVSIVFRPCFERIPIANPFAKLDALYIQKHKDCLTVDIMKKRFTIKADRAINRYLGIRFDMLDSEAMHKNIIYHNILKTDMEQSLSRLWVRTQLECVFDPSVARDSMLKEKELQVELARRKGKAESI